MLHLPRFRAVTSLTAGGVVGRRLENGIYGTQNNLRRTMNPLQLAQRAESPRLGLLNVTSSAARIVLTTPRDYNTQPRFGPFGTLHAGLLQRFVRLNLAMVVIYVL